MLPMLMRLKIVEQGRKKVNLWLPVFIAWILLFALLILFLPIALVVAVVTWGRGRGRIVLAVYPMLVSILVNLSDLHIEIEGPGQCVLISFQ